MIGSSPSSLSSSSSSSKVWPASSTLPSLGRVPHPGSYNTLCPLLVRERGDISAPVIRNNSFEHIEFEGPKLSPWPTEASSPFRSSLFPSPSAQEGSCYSDWFFRPHCTVSRDIVSEGDVHSQVPLLSFHLVLDVAVWVSGFGGHFAELTVPVPLHQDAEIRYVRTGISEAWASAGCPDSA